MKTAHNMQPTATIDNPFADTSTDQDVTNPFADELEKRADEVTKVKRLKLGFGAVTGALRRVTQRGKLEAATSPQEDNPFADVFGVQSTQENPFADGTPEEEARLADIAERARTDKAQEAARQEFRRVSQELAHRMEGLREQLRTEAARSMAERASVTDEDRAEVADIFKKQPLDTGRLVQLVPRTGETAMMYHDLYAQLRDVAETRRAAVPDDSQFGW